MALPFVAWHPLAFQTNNEQYDSRDGSKRVLWVTSRTGIRTIYASGSLTLNCRLYQGAPNQPTACVLRYYEGRLSKLQGSTVVHRGIALKPTGVKSRTCWSREWASARNIWTPTKRRTTFQWFMINLRLSHNYLDFLRHATELMGAKQVWVRILMFGNRKNKVAVIADGHK